MILFKKTFWTTVLSIALTLLGECVLAILLIMIIWGSIYYPTEYEPLNSGTPVLFVKGFLILLSSIYNIKKTIAAFETMDLIAVFGFITITIAYSGLFAFSGGGGR